MSRDKISFPKKDKDRIIKELEKEGYGIENTLIEDWGITVKLIFSKNGKPYYMALREAFYDTDKDGEITKAHGVLDIRTTPWYINLLKKEGIIEP